MDTYRRGDMKRVLIAHQSTIPHYRVDFYNALQAAPRDWIFDVVFDPTELTKRRFFMETVDPSTFRFPILPTRTWYYRYGEKVFNFQSFFFDLTRYDLVVVGSSLANITYPLCQWHRFFGRKLVVWGHGRDRTVVQPTMFKRMLEGFRSALARSADGFLAYTPDICEYLITRGVPSEKITVLYNTIDIETERARHLAALPCRAKIRSDLMLPEDARVLLFVGRFTRNKRIDFLLEAYKELQRRDGRYYLFLVGDGTGAWRSLAPPGVRFFGALTGDNLTPVYAAADIFTFPGDVGLGPLQALCHDLPVVACESPTHMPEYAYLNAANSRILRRDASPVDYAIAITQLFDDPKNLVALRATIWESISYLTVSRMAANFVDGIDAAFARRGAV